jgi:hypothetical protein
MPVDDPRSQWSRFAEGHIVEIAFAILFAVALTVVVVAL